MRVPHTIAATSLALGLIAAGCGERSAVANPFPEGLDTVSLASGTVVLQAEVADSGAPAIVAIDVSPDGSMVVAADAAGRVWTVDREGRPGSVDVDRGGDSDPPTISAVVALSDGRVAVRDARAGRVRVLAPSGVEEAAWSASAGRPPYGRDALLRAPDGTLYQGIRPELSPESPPVDFPRPAYVRVTTTGEVLDTLWVDSREVVNACPTRSEGHFRAGWFEDIRVRYVPKVQWAVGPDGSFVWGCPADYSFTVRRPGGEAVTMARQYRPHAVSEEERRDFVNIWIVQMNNSGVREEEWRWDDPRLPGLKPAYGRILPASDGRVWVWPAQPSVAVQASSDWIVAGLPTFLWTEAKTGAFDVFGSDGRLLGHVRLPERLPYTPYADTPDPVIRGDTIWAVTRDPASGVDRVERFVVDWDGAAGAP